MGFILHDIIYSIIIYIYTHDKFIEGSLEVKLPTIWTDEKQRWEESEKRREEERRSKKEKVSEERRSRRAKRKVGRSRNTVFQAIYGAGGSKSKLAKPAGQMRDEKLHAVVAPSTFPSQNIQNKPCSDHFLEVVMSKKCTLFGREAHVEAKSVKD